MWNSPIDRLRLVGVIEAISFLLLLGVAMPLKYLAGQPEAVQVVGMAHGVLWVLYLIVVGLALAARAITRTQAGIAVVASILPFGPIVFDLWWLKDRPPASAQPVSVES